MVKKLKAIIGSVKSNLNVKLDGAIPLGVMSTEQYDRYKRIENISTETTSLEYKNQEDKTLHILYTFLHPASKAKFNLVYDDTEEMIMILPDISLNVNMGVPTVDIIGYAIGGASKEVKAENLNYKKSIDTNFKIKLDVNKLEILKTKIKTAILAIHGADIGSVSGRGYGHYAENGDYTEYHTYPQAILRIDFTDEILNETLPVNILTTYNIVDDKIISNNFILTENVQNNIVFLSL